MAETYQKGEYIRYACNGVCLVDDVRLDRLTKKEPPKEFYILKPVSNPASTLFVPTGNATLVAKMSRLPDREELDALILATREEPLDWIDDRKIRLASFQTIVKECDLGQRGSDRRREKAWCLRRDAPPAGRGPHRERSGVRPEGRAERGR